MNLQEKTDVCIFGSPGVGFSAFPEELTRYHQHLDQDTNGIISYYRVKHNTAQLIYVIYGLIGASKDGEIRGGRNLGISIRTEGFRVSDEKFEKLFGFIKTMFHDTVNALDFMDSDTDPMRITVWRFSDLEPNLSHTLEQIKAYFLEYFGNHFVQIDTEFVKELDPEKLELLRKREQERKERRRKQEQKARNEKNQKRNRVRNEVETVNLSDLGAQVDNLIKKVEVLAATQNTKRLSMKWQLRITQVLYGCLIVFLFGLYFYKPPQNSEPPDRGISKTRAVPKVQPVQGTADSPGVQTNRKDTFSIQSGNSLLLDTSKLFAHSQGWNLNCDNTDQFFAVVSAYLVKHSARKKIGNMDPLLLANHMKNKNPGTKGKLDDFFDGLPSGSSCDLRTLGSLITKSGPFVVLEHENM